MKEISELKIGRHSNIWINLICKPITYMYVLSNPGSCTVISPFETF